MCEKLQIEQLQQYKKFIQKSIVSIRDEKNRTVRYYDDLTKKMLQEEGALQALEKLIKLAEVSDEIKRDNAARA